MKTTTEQYLLKSQDDGDWRITTLTDFSLLKSRQAAQHEGESLVPVKLTRARLTDEDRVPTGRPGAFMHAYGSPAPVTLYMTSAARQELRRRVAKAAQQGTAPSTAPMSLDSGGLDLGVVQRVLGISADQQQGDVAEPLRKAYRAHAADHRTSPVDLRAAAEELDALAERLDARRGR